MSHSFIHSFIHSFLTSNQKPLRRYFPKPLQTNPTKAAIPVKKGFVLFLAYCVLFQSTAFAASPATEQKEQIVLLPISALGMAESERSLYRDAVAQGLSSNYRVKYGDQVDKVIHDVFNEESKSGLECDESRCYRDIATMLNVRFIAKTTIIPRGGDYQISMVIYNVYENNALMTKVVVCKKCETNQLLEKLITIAGSDAGNSGVAGASATTEETAAEGGKKEEGVKWYWYLLGALAIGGAAAALGGGGGGGGGSSSVSSSTATGTGTGTGTGIGIGIGTGTSVPVWVHW